MQSQNEQKEEEKKVKLEIQCSYNTIFYTTNSDTMKTDRNSLMELLSLNKY